MSSSEREPFDPTAEWLEADGVGGFASGTVGGVRTRRYHALLLTATTSPGGRMVLVNGFDAGFTPLVGPFRFPPKDIGPMSSIQMA
jgi:Glycogen debranching enzyme N terminal